MILLRLINGRSHVYPVRSGRRHRWFDSSGTMQTGDMRPRAWRFKSGPIEGYAAVDETRIDAELRIRKFRGTTGSRI